MEGGPAVNLTLFLSQNASAGTPGGAGRERQGEAGRGGARRAATVRWRTIRLVPFPLMGPRPSHLAAVTLEKQRGLLRHLIEQNKHITL